MSDTGASSTMAQPTAQPMFMPNISISTVTPKIAGLIMSVRELESRIVANAMTGDQVKESFSEMYPSADLFSPDILSFPAIYSNIRDWLNKNGANIHCTIHVVTLAARARTLRRQ
eukprot:IDg987t1